MIRSRRTLRVRTRAALLAAGILAAHATEATAGTPDDGRVNPEEGEYYSLYCVDDDLEVRRSIPTPELVKSVDLRQLPPLDVGAAMDLGDFMTLVRNAEDTFTVFGSNGNTAPEPGQKSFGLSECIERNGGLPELPSGNSPLNEDLSCRISCASCWECAVFNLIALLIGLDGAGEEEYDFWTLLLVTDSDGCPILCIDQCTGLPVPDVLPTPLSARSRGPTVPGADESGLFLYYAVRDRILAPRPRGRHYRDLYAEHSNELLALLVTNWGLWNVGLDLLVRFEPHLLALVEGRGAEVPVSQEDVAAVEAFLDAVAARAGPELQAVLAQERGNAQLPQLVGMHMEEARRTLVGAASCPAAPDPACAGGFAKANLKIDERKPGKEKVALKLKKGPALTQPDLGDPTAADGTELSVCLYDDAGVLTGALGVARGGETCAKKPCWKSLGGPPPGGKGFSYRDRAGLADGVRKAVWKGGAAGRSGFQASASNRAKKSETRLPDGLAAALASTSEVTVQVRASDGACVGTTLSDVVRQEAARFQAR